MSSTQNPTPSRSPAAAAAAPSTLELAAQAPARLDSFTPIHKGMRRSLFETALLLARTDFESHAETAAAEAATSTCLGYLREHADHEDRHVIPRLAEIAPELAAELEAAHPQLEHAALDIECMGQRLPGLPPAEREALGGEMLRRFHGLIADQIRHMEREERQANAAFWGAVDDGAMAAISKAIIATIEPARMDEWKSIFAASLSPRELAMMAPPRAA